MTVLRLTRCYPVIKNREIVNEFFKKKEGEIGGKPVMFVANHCSWMDIPFLGAVMGWRNYKIVSKKELGKVPILGGALYAGGHVLVDRTDRRSQIKTLKQGINYLKDVRLRLRAIDVCFSAILSKRSVVVNTISSIDSLLHERFRIFVFRLFCV